MEDVAALKAALESSKRLEAAHGISIGVLGGGQLGRMMAQAASRLGLKLTVLDPGGLKSPAGTVCGSAVEGSFTDEAKIRELAGLVDVLTVEIEHVDAQVLGAIEKEGLAAVHPAPATLELIQDKLLQKRALAAKEGVVCGDFCEVGDAAAIVAAGAKWGYPLMLKARKGAYDGRGNQPVKSADEAEGAFAALSAGGKVKLYVERWCPFVRELAVMVCRGADGELVNYPVVETRQKESMCHTVIAPAQVSADTARRAVEVARAAVGSLQGRGIFGVELFELDDGSVTFNELAPRPHNSGHYTLDACATEQHEQHLRAVAGLPLGDTSLVCGGAAMLNIIGDGELSSTLKPVERALGVRGASVHWYGKAPPKPKRKMGHINVCSRSAAAAAAAVAAIEAGVSSSAPPLVGVIMGSDSDLPTMKGACEHLEQFGVPFECTIVSAHRTPNRLCEYAKGAEARGIRVIIAGAGGAAHLPGMVAAMTPLPVVGVPVKTSTLSGNDSLLSIVQMPRGVPVATVAIGNSANAGLLAVRILGASDASLRDAMSSYMRMQESEVLRKAETLESVGFREYLRTELG